MNLSQYLPVYDTKRLSEDQFTQLHTELHAQFTYYLQDSQDDEFWVLKDEIGYHVWALSFHLRYQGEETILSHVLVTSLQVEPTLHGAIDALSAALKARHPQPSNLDSDGIPV